VTLPNERERKQQREREREHWGEAGGRVGSLEETESKSRPGGAKVVSERGRKERNRGSSTNKGLMRG